MIFLTIIELTNLAEFRSGRMSVAGPAFRLTRARTAAIARLVTKAAGALSAELGYRASETG